MGHFGVDLGINNNEKVHVFLKGFVKIAFLKKMRLGKASWTELGSILTPKRLQKGSQMGPNIDPKWDQKTIKK